MERMKTLITEDKARFEQKYQSPEVLPSFHNFCVLSNNEKAVQVPNEERRFFLLRASRILYGTSASSATHKKHMAHLWNCVKDPTFQELFYQFLLGVDTSNILKGQAPHTSFKQRIHAQHAPEAIKFLVDALDDVSIMAKPMADLSNDYDRQNLMAEIEEKQRFKLKHRPAANQPYFPNLIGEEWEEAMLKQDLDKRSIVKEVIPHRHVVHQVIAHFRDESYHKLTAEDINSALEQLGLTKNHQIKIPLGSTTRRCYAFPSVEGLRYMLTKQHWLGDEEEMISHD